MEYIFSRNAAPGIKALSDELISSLKSGKKTLWLICGGSNISTAVEVSKSLRSNLSGSELHDLLVMQTDERFGPIGHPDSNWQQMIDLGFDLDGLSNHPVLKNLSLEETVRLSDFEIKEAFAWADYVVALFGIGADGHIAGILPHSPAVSDEGLFSGYQGQPFTRLTLTSSSLRKISVAYVLVFGETKREAIANLKNKNLTVEEEPCQILKEIPEAKLFSDLV